MRRLVFCVAAIVLPVIGNVQAAGLGGLARMQAQAPRLLYQHVNVQPPQSSMFWLVVSSRPSYGEASAVAQQFAMTLGPTAIIQSNNGLYAVVAGTLFKDKAKQNLSTLKALQLIPDDAFLSAGTNFSGVVSHTYGARPMTDLMTQSVYKSTVRRMQSVFRQMDIYSGPADGLIGPATVKSYNTYKSVYPGPSDDHLSSYDISSMETNARDGFQSHAERQAALEGGFKDAAEYRRARSGGFTSSYDYANAQEAGLSSQAEYVAYRSSGFPDAYSYRAARSHGFDNKAAYEEAVATGFRTKADFDLARLAGFRSANDYNEARKLNILSYTEFATYKSSGFSDVSVFRVARAKGISSQAAWNKSVADELAVTREAAKAVLSDTETFLKLNPSAPNLIVIADAAAALSATLREAPNDAVKQASAKLNDTLASVHGWNEFAARRLAERAEEVEASKRETHRHMTARQSQLTKWVAANITSPKLPEVVGELKLLGEAIGSDEMRTLDIARSSIEAVITRLDLEAELAELGPLDPASTPENASPETSKAPFEVTPLNRDLLTGPLEAEVVLLNTSATAPSIMRTIEGGYSFTEDEATICVIGVDVTPTLERGLLDAVKPLGATQLAISGKCNASSPHSVDLLIIKRKNFVESDMAFASAILSAIADGSLRGFSELNFSRVLARQQEEDRQSTEIARGVADGTQEGYGALLFPVQAGSICLAIDGEPKLHSTLVDRVTEFDTSRRPTSTISGSLEEMYKEMRRGKCEILYSSAPSLKKIAEAYDRDGLKYAFAPLWFDTATVDRELTRTANGEAERIKAAEAKRLEAELNKQAEERRKQEQAASKTAMQAKLRSENQTAATAAMNVFVDGIKLTVLKDAAGVPADQADRAAQIASLFPDFVGWANKAAADDWQAVSAVNDISDFGKVAWKGRSLEAVVVESRVKMSSRERGEYLERCVLLGAIVDREFEAVRDPVEVECEGDEEALSKWKIGHEFESRWSVQ